VSLLASFIQLQKFFLLVFLYPEEGRKLTLTAFKPLSGVHEEKNNALFEKIRPQNPPKTFISTVKGHYRTTDSAINFSLPG